MLMRDKHYTLRIVSAVGTCAPLILVNTLIGIKQFLIILDNVDSIGVRIGKPVRLTRIGTPVYFIGTYDSRRIGIVANASGFEFYVDRIVSIRKVKYVIRS